MMKTPRGAWDDPHLPADLPLRIVWDHMGGLPNRGGHGLGRRDGDEVRVSLVHSGGPLLEDEDQREAMIKEWRRDMRALQGLLDDA